MGSALLQYEFCPIGAATFHQILLQRN